MPEDRSEWLRCRPWIEAALEYAHGTHAIEDVEDGIEQGRFHFFCSPKSAVVVEFLQFPQKKAMNYFLIGGDLDELIEKIEPNVTRWAKQEHGCSLVFGVGRKGLERVFAPSGFHYGWTAIVKEI